LKGVVYKKWAWHVKILANFARINNILKPPLEIPESATDMYTDLY